MAIAQTSTVFITENPGRGVLILLATGAGDDTRLAHPAIERGVGMAGFPECRLQASYQPLAIIEEVWI